MDEALYTSCRRGIQFYRHTTFWSLTFEMTYAVLKFKMLYIDSFQIFSDFKMLPLRLSEVNVILYKCTDTK